MRRVAWIAEDIVREGLTRGLLVVTLCLTVLLAAQAGWCQASMASLPWPWADLALRESIAWAGAGPLVPAVIFPWVLLRRRIERGLEPLLCSPATAVEIVAGGILPGLAGAAVLAPLAAAAGALGYRLGSGRMPRWGAGAMADDLASLFAASALLSAFALHGALSARRPGTAFAALLPALLLVSAADAARLALRAAGAAPVLPLAGLIAAALLAPALAAARFDRSRILAGLR